MAALTFRCGPARVDLSADGVVTGVVPDRDPGRSFLTSGGELLATVAGRPVRWGPPAVSADADEVEVSRTSERLHLVLRHAFAAGWGVRVALTNVGDRRAGRGRRGPHLAGAGGAAGVGAGRGRVRQLRGPAGRRLGSAAGRCAAAGRGDGGERGGSAPGAARPAAVRPLRRPVALGPVPRPPSVRPRPAPGGAAPPGPDGRRGGDGRLGRGRGAGHGRGPGRGDGPGPGRAEPQRGRVASPSSSARPGD